MTTTLLQKPGEMLEGPVLEALEVSLKVLELIIWTFFHSSDAYDTQGKKKSPFMQFSDPDEDNFAFMSLNKATPPQDVSNFTRMILYSSDS